MWGEAQYGEDWGSAKHRVKHNRGKTATIVGCKGWQEGAWMDGWMDAYITKAPLTEVFPHRPRARARPEAVGERGAPPAGGAEAAGAVCAENSASSQGRKEPGAAASHCLVFAKQPPAPRKSPTRPLPSSLLYRGNHLHVLPPSLSWASGNGAGSARLKAKIYRTRSVCVCRVHARGGSAPCSVARTPRVVTCSRAPCAAGQSGARLCPNTQRHRSLTWSWFTPVTALCSYQKGRKLSRVIFNYYICF